MPDLPQIKSVSISTSRTEQERELSDKLTHLLKSYSVCVCFFLRVFIPPDIKESASTLE